MLPRLAIEWRLRTIGRMLTDSHCHLANRRFEAAEVDELVARARAAGVGRIVTLATDLDDLIESLAIADRHECVGVAAGIHPCDVHEAPADVAVRLAAVLADPRVVAVGETGLDYYHPAPDGWEAAEFRERQLELLERHFELAAAAGLNVVIHTRDRAGDASFRDALAVYARHAGRVRAVFHCFAGPWPAARRVLDLGGLLSFTGIVTFPNAGDALETAARCPAGGFMIETDAPFLAPVPERGRRNEPAFVRHVADCLAAARNESPAALAEHTSATAAGFFRGASAAGG
jgi:TatD DNase family protein